MAGMKLAIPVGDDVVALTITPKAEAIRFSLRTSDPTEIKDRQAGAASYLARLFDALRADAPMTLSHRNAVALAGEFYRSWSSDLKGFDAIGFEHTEQGWVKVHSVPPPEMAAAYEAIARKVGELEGKGDEVALEHTLGPLVDRLLIERGLAKVDADSRLMVLQEAARALRDGLEAGKRKASGDYSKDPMAERFPEWNSGGGDQAAAVSLRGLVDGWWTEAKARNLSPSTHESYRKAVGSFADFLGHDDALQVRTSDVIRFKDDLLSRVDERSGKTLSAKTVKDSYLSGLKSVFAWAISNGKLPANPATGVSMKLGKRTRLRQTWFTNEERKSLFRAALQAKTSKRQPSKRQAMYRWVPLLCAYSGARVGEIVQLRKQDVRREGADWIITITPEAGTVKTKEMREVPVHEHLVELGFAEFVKGAEEGPLFMWSGHGRSAWRTAKNRMVEFVREVVQDPNVMPNHAWRHTFKTIGSEAGIQDKVLDAICGHAPRTEGEAYGGVTLAAKVRAIKRFPKFEFDAH